MPNFPYLDRAGLKPYDVKYILMNGDHEVGRFRDDLKQAVEIGGICRGGPVTIRCELSGKGSQTTHLILTLDQARRITGSAVGP